MKGHKMKSLLCICLALLILNGCSVEKRKNYIILVDNSISTREQYIENYLRIVIDIIIPNLGIKDRITIMMIDKNSYVNNERIWTLDLSDQKFENISDGLINEQDSIRVRKARFLSDSLKKELVNTLQLSRLKRNSFSDFTDIINAINESRYSLINKTNFNDTFEKIKNNAFGVNNYIYENCIIILSDMINEDQEGEYNFRKSVYWDYESISDLVDNLSIVNKIPNLTNTKVFIHGATSCKNMGRYSNKQIENIKIFWDLYFKKSRAQLIAYSYDTKQEINDYMKE